MTPTQEQCAKCGYPQSEHHHDGACYGICGKFVAPTAAAGVGDVPIPLMSWMANLGYATGHGDTLEDILNELHGQTIERCAQLLDDNGFYAGAIVLRRTLKVKP